MLALVSDVDGGWSVRPNGYETLGFTQCRFKQRRTIEGRRTKLPRQKFARHHRCGRMRLEQVRLQLANCLEDGHRVAQSLATEIRVGVAWNTVRAVILFDARFVWGRYLSKIWTREHRKQPRQANG